MNSPESALEVHDLTARYHHRPVVWGLDFTLPVGSRTAIVGPNGAGKSTLLKAIVGLVPIASGYVQVYGRPFAAQRALVAYVPQREQVDWNFPVSVWDVAMMGRTLKLPWYGRPSAHDVEVVADSLRTVDMLEYRERPIGALSGGQQQRVFLARALAQEASLYLLDEPFAGVDAVTEQKIADVFRRLAEAQRTIVVVHHDLSTVRSYFDHVVLMNIRQVACGPVESVFSVENLSKTYGPQLVALGLVTEELNREEWRGRHER